MFLNKKRFLWPDELHGPWSVALGEFATNRYDLLVIIGNGADKYAYSVMNNDYPDLLLKLKEKEAELGVKLPTEEEIKKLLSEEIRSMLMNFVHKSCVTAFSLGLAVESCKAAVEDAVCEFVISS